MFKDKYAKRTCIHCDGKGYCESYSSKSDPREKFDVKVIHKREKCSSWTDEGKWVDCKKCGKPVPDTKDFKEKLCSDCLHPKKRKEIVFEENETDE